MNLDKPKLSISEQIDDLKRKGITFNYINESDAKKFLTNNNYYFKLKSYQRNYDKYSSTAKKGQYINLDFAYLKELSTIDMYLRKLILFMALDIEHALKVQLLYDLSCNPNEDGYSIVKEYLDYDFIRVKNLHDKVGKSATSDLISKHLADDRYALWEIVEILSFGEFIDIYQLYYSKYPSSNDYSSYLWSIKFLRNAAAHNNCILNSLKAPYKISFQKNKNIIFEISKIKTISEKSRNTWMQNPVIHDFLILLFVYLHIIKSTGIRKSGIDQITWLFNERMKQNPEFFEKNISIKEAYSFTNKVINTFCNKYRK